MKYKNAFTSYALTFMACAFFAVLVITAHASVANAQKTPESFADLAEKLLPTVVNVSTTQKVTEYPYGSQNPMFPGFPEGSPFNDLFREFFDDRMFRRPMPGQNGAKPREYSRPSALGSGFVVDAENGYIVTNNHVIEDADEIKIILQDDTTLDAELVGMDDKTDIAVLKVKTDVPLVAAQWGDSDEMRVGDWVMAIGNPFGLGGTVTAGIISARQRDIHAGPYDDFIQTDASINRGNSGGPMFNMNGDVIGINTAIYSPSGGSVGIGFAIPSAMAQSVVDQIIEFGKTRRGWLGVRFQSVTDEIAESLGLDKDVNGVLVAGVSKNGPAEKAGIKAGDVIIGFNGKDIDEMRALPRLVADAPIGKPVDVTIWRDEKEVTLRVVIGEMEEEISESDDDTQAVKKSDLTTLSDVGLTVSAMTDELRDMYEINSDVNGVVITQVEPSSQAAAKRITEGTVITELNQQPVSTPQDIEDLFEKAKKSKKSSVLLLVNQDGVVRFVALSIKD